MNRTHRPLLAWAGLATAAALTGCTATEAASPSSPTAPPAATAQTPDADGTSAPGEVATGFDVPWSIAFVDGAAVVSERDTGLLREVLPDGTLRTVGEVPGVSHTARDGGLMGLAAHDEGLFVYYTADTGNRIARFDIGGSAGALTLGSGEDVFEIPAASRHNGGRIAFGPDGMLYLGVGDTGVPSTAQDLDSLAGKILRIRPDGAVPEDNPFPGSAVYSYGHRNVQGIAWAADGTMFASEFGEDAWDELNIITPGANYGWPEVEGAGGSGDAVDPVQQWTPDTASPSGITIVDDVIYIANLRGERLTAVPVEAPDQSTERYVGEYGRLRDVVPAPDGGLWMLTNNSGRETARPGDDRIVSVPLS
jgi:glucose/arabinose dehydrogenase